jgi:hypothetical protein
MYSRYNKDTTCLSSKIPTCLIYKTLTFMLYDLINQPNIMEAPCSCGQFKEWLKLNQMKYQLVSPNDHRGDIAETAIKIFKGHIISILCGCDKSFSLNLLDRLLPQSEHTLNMLQPARMTPTMSAYAYLWGQHNYNANPFAPLECKVNAHITPGVCEMWAPTSPVVVTPAMHGSTTSATESTSVIQKASKLV